ncbi:hypothetical protein MY1884_006875 [Beauveria asiatica]
MAEPIPLPIIHINGFPGTGKLTVAKHLEQLLTPRARLVHNHLLINAADAVLRRDEAGYQNLRRAVRTAVFSSLADSAATHKFVYLFTDFQSNDEVGSGVCAEYLAAARQRKCKLVSVILGCDVNTNVGRLVTGERRAHGKITDEALLRKFRDAVDIHRFEDLEVSSLEMDVSSVNAEEAAKQILQHVVRVCPEVSYKSGE